MSVNPSGLGNLGLNAPECLWRHVSHDFTLICRSARRSFSVSHQPLQTETLEGPEEGIVLPLGRFFGGCSLADTKWMRDFTPISFYCSNL